MSRWEDKYNELAPSIDNKISELEGRIQEKNLEEMLNQKNLIHIKKN